MKEVLRWAVIAGGFSSAVYLLILVRAEVLFSRDTPVSVAAAVHLQPDNSVYLNRLASWQSQDAQLLLHRSVTANPYDSDAWIRLGLLAEMQNGDSPAAEKYFLQAAQVNHLFTPKWTLTNFYFREQNASQFFQWAKLTLAITPYGSEPVFAQMWLMSQNPERLNETIPDRPRILLQYAWYLTNSKHFESIPQTVERLVRFTSKEDADKWGKNDLLAVSLDKMLAAGAVTPALRVWSTLDAAGWLGEESIPNPQHPITNGDFRERFYRHGFDWVDVENAGTRVEQYPEPPTVHISLYGDQAEQVSLLEQYVPVTPGQHYFLAWHAEPTDMPDGSGLAWRLHPLPDGIAPDQISEDLLSPGASWTVTSPQTAKVMLLSLEYKRPPGRMRARGSVVLQSIAMRPR